MEPLEKDAKKAESDGGINLKNISFESLSLLDFDTLYDIVWVLAKSADSSIPDPLSWLDQFDSFPISEILPEIQDLLAHSIKTEKK